MASPKKIWNILKQFARTGKEFVQIIEEFGLNYGLGLIDYRIVFAECPTADGWIGELTACLAMHWVLHVSFFFRDC